MGCHLNLGNTAITLNTNMTKLARNPDGCQGKASQSNRGSILSHQPSATLTKLDRNATAWTFPYSITICVDISNQVDVTTHHQ
ncbi:hypothetical protein MHBO_004401 [Bonamia ostreae]|uniref:Uncharacterized protein n=1 Tax=Bonamia ostreae TaxID=126728 RepID=A0ABV2AT74_9EUKA